VIVIIVIIELPLRNQRLLDLGQIQHIWTHINLVCDTASVSISATTHCYFAIGIINPAQNSHGLHQNT
jgi:hypothetical protein